MNSRLQPSTEHVPMHSFDCVQERPSAQAVKSVQSPRCLTSLHRSHVPHMQRCAGSLAGSVNRAGGAARWKGRAPVIVAVAVDGPARTTPLVHVASCTPRSHSTAPQQAAQPAPDCTAPARRVSAHATRCTATAGAGADPCHAWHAAAGPAAGRAGCSSAPKEGAIGVYGHGAARGAGPTGNQVHERAARQTAQLEHGAARR